MSNIRVRIRNPEAIRARLRPVQSIRVGTTDTYLFDPDLILDSVEDARDWAIKTDGLVDSEDYSSKAWAIGGTGTETNNSKYWASESATSASNAATSETNAGLSATSASNSASTATTQAGIATTQAGIATTKAGEASTSASTATTQAGIATTKAGEALTSANNASNSASDALGYSNSASGYATSASNSATSAGTSATNAQVWAEGTDAQVQALGGIHSAKTWVATIGTVYKAQGSVLFANLPTLDANHEGYVYNISDDFTTTSDFVEGAGKNYTAGTNVVCINYNGTYMWDIIGGMIDIPDPLPAQTGNEGKFLTTDGTDASWKYVLNYIGTYSATTQYHPGDIVQNYVQGGYHKYLCKKDALGQYPDVTNDYWQDLTGYISGLYQYSNDYPLISYLVDGWSGNTAKSVRLIVPQTSAAVSNIPTVNTYSGLLKVPGGIDGYYTSSQVDNALGNKQDTLTAGNGIDITANTISVTTPTLTNTAVGTNSLAILGTINSASSAVAVGDGSEAGANGTSLGKGAYAGNGGLSLGALSKANGSWATAIGNGNSSSNSASATGSGAIAIGHDAHASGTNSYQIGEGTNSTADSLQVGSYELLDTSTGLIPDARISTNIARTSGIPTSVDDLSDVTVSGATDGQALVYNSVSQKWENSSIPGVTVDQIYDATSNNAQSGTAVAGAIANMVTTDTAQTISGVKTFTGCKLYLQGTDANNGAFVVKSPNTPKGTNPTGTEYYELLAQDNSGLTTTETRLGHISFSRDSNGTVGANMRVYQNVANSTSSGAIAIQINSSGTISTTAPTPAASSNTTNIATTAWVKSFANTSGANYMTTFSKGGNGYFKFTNGLIIQWGNSASATSPRTITFPTAFTSTNYRFVFNFRDTTGQLYAGAVDSKTTTGCKLRTVGGANDDAADWVAIGY